MSYPPSQGGSYPVMQNHPSAPSIEEHEANVRQVEGYGQQKDFHQKQRQDIGYTPQNMSGYPTENPPQCQPPANGYPLPSQPTSMAGHPTQQVPGYQQQSVTPLHPGYPPHSDPGYPPQSTPGYPHPQLSAYPPYPQPATGYPSHTGHPPMQSSGYLQPAAFPSKVQTQPMGPTIIVQPPCLTSLGSCPSSCFCPTCHTIVITRCEYTNSSNSWLICMILFFAGFCFLLPWFLCWIPFCMDSMKTVVHRCPQCGSHLGTHQGGKM